MQKILNKREKFILGATVLVIIFAFVFNFILSPFFKRNDALNKEIRVTKTKLNKYLRLLSQKDSLQTKYSQFVPLREATQTANPLVEALQEIESLAKQAGITIADIRPQTEVRTGPKDEIIVEIRTSGAPESYMKFIHGMENSLSLLEVKKFQLNARPSTQNLEGSFTILKLNISG